MPQQLFESTEEENATPEGLQKQLANIKEKLHIAHQTECAIRSQGAPIYSHTYYQHQQQANDYHDNVILPLTKTLLSLTEKQKTIQSAIREEKLGYPSF